MTVFKGEESKESFIFHLLDPSAIKITKTYNDTCNTSATILYLKVIVDSSIIVHLKEILKIRQNALNCVLLLYPCQPFMKLKAINFTTDYLTWQLCNIFSMSFVSIRSHVTTILDFKVFRFDMYGCFDKC